MMVAADGWIEKGQVDNWIVLSVVLAEGVRPVPSRTRKLSPPAPMVLHSTGCGRVGHRRHQTRNKWLRSIRFSPIFASAGRGGSSGARNPRPGVCILV